eukprot:6183294-Pleurochrysis_carterae.AAC.2
MAYAFWGIPYYYGIWMVHGYLWDTDSHTYEHCVLAIYKCSTEKVTMYEIWMLPHLILILSRVHDVVSSTAKCIVYALTTMDSY